MIFSAFTRSASAVRHLPQEDAGLLLALLCEIISFFKAEGKDPGSLRDDGTSWFLTRYFEYLLAITRQLYRLSPITAPQASRYSAHTYQ